MANINALKQDKSETEKKLKQYEKRLKEIKTIRGNLDNVCGDYVPDINKKVGDAIKKFNQGINVGNSNVDSILSAVRQLDQYSDTNISGSKSDLGREISRIEGKIEELKRDIRLLTTSIADAKEED